MDMLILLPKGLTILIVLAALNVKYLFLPLSIICWLIWNWPEGQKVTVRNEIHRKGKK